MNVKKKLAIAGTSALLAAGLGVGVAQFASADPTTTPSPSPSQSGTQTQNQNGEGNRGEGRMGTEMAKELAAKLGLDESKVTTALQEAHKALRDDSDFKTMTPQQRHEALAKQLASKLGVSESKVKTALDEIQGAHRAEARTEFKTRLDQAVKDGKLTQTEADAVLKAWDAGVLGQGMGRGGGGPRR